MAGGINQLDNGQAAIALRRAQLEARVGEAIARAQKNYLQVQEKPVQAPTANGPSHLGSRIDVRA